MRLAIGDIHGRNFWRDHLKEDWTECYILGDYFDSYDISCATQCYNFTEICRAARNDPRIKLCLGNHDYHYLGDIWGQRYSGFQEKHFYEIYMLLEENIDLLKVVYITDDGYILSHAGVSKTFMQNNKINDVNAINDAFINNRNILTFDGYEEHGDDVTQSPIWIRPRSLHRDAVSGYNQIVGHTMAGKIRMYPISDGKKIICIDTGSKKSVFWF
jgi:hypothetical protein